MREFLSFESYITPRLVRIVFVVGLVLLVLGAIAQMVELTPYYGFFGGVIMPLIALAVLVLLWRIYCEIILVVFDIRDKVASLAHRPLP